MKRILKSFRPKQQQSAVGTGDLTGSSRRASLDESDDDGSDNDDAEVHYAVADVDDDNTAHNKNNNATRASYDTPVISNAKSATTYDETVESYYNNSEKAATKNGGHRVVTGMPPPPPPRASTRCDETRNLVKKFIADIWNRGELDLIPDVCSPSLRFNGNTGKCIVLLVLSTRFYIIFSIEEKFELIWNECDEFRLTLIFSYIRL